MNSQKKVFQFNSVGGIIFNDDNEMLEYIEYLLNSNRVKEGCVIKHHRMVKPV